MNLLTWFRRRVLGRSTKAEVVADLLAAYPDCRTHDLCVPSWGHNITPVGNHRFAVWTTPALRVGDRVKTELGTFVAHTVEPCGDPSDMVWAWFYKIPEERT